VTTETTASLTLTLEELYASVMDHVVLVRDDRFVSVSPKWEGLLGWTPEQLCAEPFLSFIHPDDVERTAAEAGALFDGGQTVGFRNRYRTASGGYVWLDWSARLVPTGEILAFARDITEQLRREQELRFLHELGTDLAGADELDEIVRISVERLCELTGASWAEVWAGDDGELPVLRERWRQPGLPPFATSFSDERAAAGMPSVSFGSSRVVIGPVADADRFLRRGPALEAGLQGLAVVPFVIEGRRIGVLLLLHESEEGFGQWQALLEAAGRIIANMMERRRVVAALRELNQELEGRVVERTAELEQVVRELESFTATVSHDLRAPLRAMDGFARILRAEHAEALDEEARHFLDRVCANAERMRKLIDDLLEYSRMTVSELPAHEAVDVATLVGDVVASLVEERAYARATVEVGPLPPCHGDRALLRSLFLNVLDNALKFSREAEAPRVTVTGTTEGDEVVYRVVDNGIGYDARYEEKLFQIFQRLHPRSDHAGTGVGLATVKRVCDLHGGSVSASTDPGVATTFTIRLPAVREEGSR
jgi:PAS domain S-box-containing protein